MSKNIGRVTAWAAGEPESPHDSITLTIAVPRDQVKAFLMSGAHKHDVIVTVEGL